MQAAKAGLLEIADVFVVNKADRAGVDETVRDLEQMLELSGARRLDAARSCETVATDGEGIDELWAAIGEHRAPPRARTAGSPSAATRALRDELRAIVVARLAAQVERRVAAGADVRRARRGGRRARGRPVHGGDPAARGLTAAGRSAAGRSRFGA